MLISRIFGVSAETDAFNVAFRIPNLLRRMFAEGAFQQAFVPMLADVRSRDEARTSEFVGRMASALFWVLLGVSVLGVIAAPILVWLIASGLARNPDAFDLATVMTRWMFPYILFMSLVALAAGVLNTYRRFAVPAATPVLLNLSFIACALWLAPYLQRPIMALAFAVVIGGVLQLAMQLLALRSIGVGVRWSVAVRRVSRPRRAPGRRADAAGAVRGVGGADQHHHQHQHRVASGDRQRHVAGIRRPLDGVSNRAAWRRARHRASAQPVGCVCRTARCGLFAPARLGTAARFPAGAAGCSRAWE